jgi:hypothetical protein
MQSDSNLKRFMKKDQDEIESIKMPSEEYLHDKMIKEIKLKP